MNVEKMQSQFQKDINRLRKECKLQSEMNILRKFQIGQFSSLIKKLIKEGKINIKDVNKYIINKEKAKKLITK
jgi:hypothetical protein